jgi:hypothetical protein
VSAGRSEESNVLPEFRIEVADIKEVLGGPRMISSGSAVLRLATSRLVNVKLTGTVP